MEFIARRRRPNRLIALKVAELQNVESRLYSLPLPRVNALLAFVKYWDYLCDGRRERIEKYKSDQSTSSTLPKDELDAATPRTAPDRWNLALHDRAKVSEHFLQANGKVSICAAYRLPACGPWPRDTCWRANPQSGLTSSIRARHSSFR